MGSGTIVSSLQTRSAQSISQFERCVIWVAWLFREQIVKSSSGLDTTAIAYGTAGSIREERAALQSSVASKAPSVSR